MKKLSRNSNIQSQETGKPTASSDISGVAIGKPERHVRKASHCGSKQQ